MTKADDHLHHPLLRDFADFFEHSLCGHAILDPAGRIVLGNGPLAGWLGHTPAAMRGRPFADFLTIGGRLFHETHLAPLLRIQGHYAEVSLELLCRDGSRLPVLVNAIERRDDLTGDLLFTRLTIVLAKERHTYEANLRAARNAAEISLLTERETAALREQFIAILGHDLRNPLGAITMGTALLADSDLSPRDTKLVAAMDSSAKRMNELIANLMDFARFRLGGGIALKTRRVDLDTIFGQVIDELQVTNPDRRIDRHLALGGPVECDPDRLSQILSNLLANALTHGAPAEPVQVTCGKESGELVLVVRNRSHAIPPELLDTLFKPFTREDARPSQHGLGLGLYIAAEVAKAHHGTLTATSGPESTDFIFRMPLE